MKSRSWLRRAVIAAVMLTGISAAAMPASAAGTSVRPASGSTYRLTFQQAGAMVLNVSATGPGDAWAIGYHPNGSGNFSSGLLMHWDGQQWQAVSYPGESMLEPESITALSPTDVWLFAGWNEGAFDALHYSDGTWSSFALPQNAIAPVLVLSDSDIWVTGGQYSVCANTGPRGCMPVSHWDGTKWQSYPVTVPTVTSLGGTSATDVWAAGNGWPSGPGTPFTARPFAFRWSGTAWQQSPLVARRANSLPGITVLSASDVWVGAVPQSRPHACAVRWQGSQWRAFYASPPDMDCRDIAPDYHGGVWIGMFLHWNGSKFIEYYPPQFPAGDGVYENLTPIPGVYYQWFYGYTQARHNGSYTMTAYIDIRAR